MKIIKSSLTLLIVAFLLDGLVVFASTLSTAVIAVNIPAGKQVETNYKTKASYAPQEYANTFTNTTLTSPCPKCPIGVKFQSEIGDYIEQTVFMNQKITCDLTALYAPGSYKIKLRRTDFTLLDTYTSGDWYY